MKPKIFLPLLFSLYIVNCTLYITPATVRYVSPTGSSTPPYTSWFTAADSIMECINISVFGDTIYVANGTYKEQVVMIPGLSLIGAGMDSCVIDAGAIADHSVFTKDSCLIAGVKIITSTYKWCVYDSGSTGSTLKYNHLTSALMDGGGIDVLNLDTSNNSNIYIYQNLFQDVTIGIDIFNSDAVIRKNIIYPYRNSQSTLIIGIFLGGYFFNDTPVIDSNYIVSSGEGIEKSFGSRPIISNNTIIVNDIASSGIVLVDSDSASVFNNVVISKSDDIGHGIRNAGVQYLLAINNFVIGLYRFSAISTGDQSVLKNNVITNSDIGVEIFSDYNILIQYNNSWNNELNYIGFTPDSTNLSVDPMIVNEDSTEGDLDFHLQKYSPLIDAGDPNIIDVDGTRSDIGLYGGPYGEQYHYIDLAPRAPVNLNATLDSLTVGVTWNKNTEADFNHYNVYRDTSRNFQIDSTNFYFSTPVSNLIDILPDYVEKIYYKVTAVDNQGNESEPSEEVGFILTSITDQQQTISDYRLYQNYPNPFNPSTKISYRLKERGYVKLYVYDIKGELISVLVNQTQEAGFYEVDFNVKGETSNVKGDLASGIYIYQIMVRSENNIPVYTDMKKMIYLK